MSHEESPEAKFDRLKRELQASVLRDYPNPERRGCPGEAALRNLAAIPLEDDIESDPNWHHVTHCSECYREFLGFSSSLKARRRAQTARIRTVAVIATVLAVVGLLFGVNGGLFKPQRPQNAELAYVKRTVNIESMQRSAEGQETKPIVLDRAPLELTVELPVGSRAGRYELQLQKNGRTLLATGSEASIRGGVTAFTVKANLSDFERGEFSIVVRQVPFDWNYYPVVVR